MRSGEAARQVRNVLLVQLSPPPTWELHSILVKTRTQRLAAHASFGPRVGSQVAEVVHSSWRRDAHGVSVESCARHAVTQMQRD